MIEDIVGNNGFDYIDLDLPSGTLWSTCNVGASKPNEPGLYFQWGDIQGWAANQMGTDYGQKEFSLNDYKWNPSGDGKTYTKYTNPGAKLEPKDDAAHVSMYGSWHIPSLEQIDELVNNTINEWITLDDMNGMKFTSKKNASKSIFIPAAGFVSLDIISGIGCVCSIWASTLNMNNSDYGQCAYFGPYNIQGSSFTLRCNGYSVRGVIG